jgi:LmeA-like phospholipid-binding
MTDRDGAWPGGTPHRRPDETAEIPVGSGGPYDAPGPWGDRADDDGGDGPWDDGWDEQPRRRRRGRRLLVVLLVLLVPLAVVLVVADRVGVRIAEKAVATQIEHRGALSGRPDVQIEGVPFLTQALRGRYDDVRVRLTAAELDQPEGTSADVSLRGVHVPLSKVVGGSVSEVPVDRVDGTASLSYSLLSSRLGADTKLSWTGSTLRITRTVQVLGYSVPLTADGAVRLDGQHLRIDVSNVQADGASVPSSVVRRASSLLDLSYAVPKLPFGLTLTGVHPGPDGVQVTVDAHDTVLRG